MADLAPDNRKAGPEGEATNFSEQSRSLAIEHLSEKVAETVSMIKQGKGLAQTEELWDETVEYLATAYHEVTNVIGESVVREYATSYWQSRLAEEEGRVEAADFYRDALDEIRAGQDADFLDALKVLGTVQDLRRVALETEGSKTEISAHNATKLSTAQETYTARCHDVKAREVA